MFIEIWQAVPAEPKNTILSGLLMFSLMILIFWIYSLWSKFKKFSLIKKKNREYETKLDRFFSDFKEIELDLQRIQTGDTDPVLKIIEFFRIFAPVYDSMLILTLDETYANIPKKISQNKREALKEVSSLLEVVGRDEFGMNRTTPNQMVTSSDVYLGGIWGINTKTASDWVSWKRQNLGKGNAKPDDIDTYKKIQAQAEHFIFSSIQYYEGILKSHFPRKIP